MLPPGLGPAAAGGASTALGAGRLAHRWRAPPRPLSLAWQPAPAAGITDSDEQRLLQEGFYSVVLYHQLPEG